MMWTKEQSKEARSLGWDVFDVHTDSGWKAIAMPLNFSGRINNARDMWHHLVSAAKQRDQLAQAALRHMMESR